jgi:hypothetical protein
MHVLRHYLVFNAANRWNEGGGRFNINHKKLVKMKYRSRCFPHAAPAKKQNGARNLRQQLPGQKGYMHEKARKSAEQGVQHDGGGMWDG